MTHLTASPTFDSMPRDVSHSVTQFGEGGAVLRINDQKQILTIQGAWLHDWQKTWLQKKNA
ncbi:MAG: hypothetical protein ACK5TR_05985 [Alphaproteobacteria bacterium]|jgi:hypothetical protein|nr:hypothetical protein [Alphaproteobacteria bacterium]